ncbi:MAG: hypothetical protein NTY02_00070 [Acidobacteria bacterium]|nr:hypothetical protein [Acidobacteriota bacterium]
MTANQNLGHTLDGSEVDRRKTYLGVLALEVLVIAALWALGRYFGSL